MHEYTVTFATLNCLNYTKQCIDSLISSGVDCNRIVVVDNASSDGTQNYLNSIKLGSVILNRQNLSCGAAWNQGILAHQSEWTIVMNNDILVTSGFAQRLISFALEHKLKLVSPARIDGSYDYNYKDFAEKAQKITDKTIRFGSSNAICMCIHWSLFSQIGFFRADPNLLGFEDGLFYNEIRKKNIQHATTGSVWIHHFGGVTQDHLKMVIGLDSNDLLVEFNDRKLYDQTWLDRKLFRHRLKINHKNWRYHELKNYGMTLHGIRKDNNFIWF